MSDENYKTSPVVGYVRSVQKNDPQLDEWESQIHQYAIERGYNLVAVLREEGVSGVTTWRPLLEQLIHQLIVGEYTGVLVPNIGHLASGNTEVRRIKTRIIDTGAWVEDLNL